MPGLAAILFEELLPLLLLLGEPGGHPRLAERLDLRTVRVEIHLGRLAGRRSVDETGLDHGQLRGRQLERGELLGDDEPERVESLVVLGLRLGLGDGGRRRTGEQREKRAGRRNASWNLS
jgi:hypothetical protein